MSPATEPDRVVLLLVDDDELVLESLSLSLTDAGFAAVTAPSGSAAIELVRQLGFEVVVCDRDGVGGLAAQLGSGFNLAIQLIGETQSLLESSQESMHGLSVLVEPHLPRNHIVSQ